MRDRARLVTVQGFAVSLAAFHVECALAQDQADEEPQGIEIVGTLQADYVQDFKRVDGNWDDTLRPSKIPTQEGAFGSDGQAVVSARQSGLGVNFNVPAGGKQLSGRFYFDLFGSGNNQGETTFHLQHAYAQWGPMLAGHTDSTFMDGDIFPNIIDFWGPAGLVYVRNAQIRWTPIDDDRQSFSLALERPSDDIDPGQIRLFDPKLGANLQADEKVPDLAAHYRRNGDWGHFQAATLLRRIGVETVGTPGNEPQNSKFGWGINLTSAVKFFGGNDQLLLGAVYGEGIASYMNDGGTDLAGEGTFATGHAKAVELTGVTAYYNHQWADAWTSSIGFSRTEVDNTSLQSPNAFKFGNYASANLLFSPNEQVLMGSEVLWGEREDKNGQSGNDVRLQFSVRYSFSGHVPVP